MRAPVVAVLYALFLLAAPLAFADTIDLTVRENGLVEERIMLMPAFSHDSITFETPEPLAVISDAPYSYENGVLTINHTGTNYAFTLLFDDFVQKHGRARSLALHIEQPLTRLTVSLPARHVLADTDPAASPKPDSMFTDGRRILMSWRDRDALDLIILYEAPVSPWPYVLLSTLALAILVFLAFRRRPDTKALDETLGEDELLVLNLVRSGKTHQQDLASELGYSKSKMSKVVRKLEEKGAIRKEPHFKTNKLELKKEWK